MHIIIETASAAPAYANIAEKITGQSIGQALKGTTGNYSISKTACIMKDHQYYRGTCSNITNFTHGFLIEITIA